VCPNQAVRDGPLHVECSASTRRRSEIVKPNRLDPRIDVNVVTLPPTRICKKRGKFGKRYKRTEAIKRM